MQDCIGGFLVGNQSCSGVPGSPAVSSALCGCPGAKRAGCTPGQPDLQSFCIACSGSPVCMDSGSLTLAGHVLSDLCMCLTTMQAQARLPLTSIQCLSSACMPQCSGRSEAVSLPHSPAPCWAKRLLRGTSAQHNPWQPVLRTEAVPAADRSDRARLGELLVAPCRSAAATRLLLLWQRQR